MSSLQSLARAASLSYGSVMAVLRIARKRVRRLRVVGVERLGSDVVLTGLTRVVVVDGSRVDTVREKPISAPPAKPARVGSRLVGIEIEAFSTYLPRSDAWYSVGDDGSIKPAGSKLAWELRTHPIPAGTVPARMKALSAELQTADADVNESCGLHVHVDARDTTARARARLLRLYAHLEPELYRLGGREPTVHCRPCGADARQAAQLGTRWLRARYLDRVSNSRYHGLNLWAYRKYGTVEFRLAAGTLDPSRIGRWTLLCAAIVQAAVDGRKLRGSPRSIINRLAKPA